MGEPGARVMCPRCGWMNQMGLASASTAAGAGSFSPPPMSPPGATAGAAATGPRKTSVQAILSLVFGVLSFLTGGIGALGGTIDSSPLGGAPLLGLGSAIAAIVLGVIGIREVNRRPYELTGKGLAITGLVLGIIYVSLLIVAIIVVLIVLAICAAACGRGGNAYVPAGIPLYGLSLGARIRREVDALRGALRRDPWGLLLLHHPRCTAFREDAVATAAGPVCASCLSLALGAVGALVTLRLAELPGSPALLSAGVAVTLLLHAASVVGLTRRRSEKMVARGLMGAGVAAVGASLPMLGWAAWIVVAAILAVGPALLWIRTVSIAARWRAHPHDARCAVTP